jgi:CRISPR-associated protein Cas1
MRKLLNTLFVLSPESYLSLKNENVVIHADDDSVRMIPLIGLESILCFSYKGASPELIGKCTQNGISITFMTPNGRYLATASGRSAGNVLLRKAQYRISDDEQKSSEIAKYMLLGKVYNARKCIERTIHDNPLRVDECMLRNAADKLRVCCSDLSKVQTLDELRGIEGKAAAEYFGVFDELILNQKDVFSFSSRTRRPPLDCVNAMLSFGYSLLAHDCAAALEAVGLDSYVGFLHRDRPGRMSGALDMMEELRSIFVDRFVITLINNRSVAKKNFDQSEDGAVLLNDSGRKIFLTSWQERKKEIITHPYLKEKMQWGLVPYVQALLLARYIRGDYDAYPPFFWR